MVNGGNAIRDFIHIDDVVRSYQAVLAGSEYELVNVASGRGVSIAGVLDTIRRAGHAVQTTDEVRKNEIRVSTANVERLGSLIDTSTFRRLEDHILERLGEVA